MKTHIVKTCPAMRVFTVLMALVLFLCAIPVMGIPASAASSSGVADAVRANLPIVTRACPLSGASRVYPYASETSGSKLTNRYIDTFLDNIVVTAIRSDGSRVRVKYPSGSKYAEYWFATDDILGISTVNVTKYTAGSKYNCYRLSSSNGLTSGGSISKGDAVTVLGKRSVGGTTYYVSIYPVSRQTVNQVGGITHKIALCKYCPSTGSNTGTASNNSNTNNTSGMTDVTRSFAGKKVILRSVENNRYLCADSNLSGTPAVCNRTSADKGSSSWEIFTVSVTGDGWAGFKASNGKWLSARIDTANSPLRADAAHLQSWEAFRIYQSKGNYYIKSQANGKWLCVRVDMSNAPVQAYASAASTWERFSITVVTGNPLASLIIGAGTADSNYAPYKGIDYKSLLNAARVNNKISNTEYINRIKLLDEAQKMVSVIWTAPVSFHTWKSGGGSYNSNQNMQYNNGTSTTSQFVKGYTYVGIPYAANAGYNNYDAEGWLSLVNESGISKSKLEGTVTYLNIKRYNTTFRGVDCSGFVHKAYEVLESYTYKDSNRLSCSGMMSSSSWKKISASQAMPGDILLKSGHVMIFLGKTADGKIAVFESVADGERGTSGCRYYEFNSVSGYSYYRFSGIGK